MTTLYKSPKAIRFILLLGVIVILLVAGVVTYNKLNKQDEDNKNNNEITDNEGENENKVLATIGDKRITQAMLDKEISRMIAAQQLPPLFETSKEEQNIKRSILNQMIDEELLIEEAKKEGISVSENDVEKRYNEVKKRFEEGVKDKTMTQALEEEGILVSEFRESLHDQLIIENYLSKLKEKYDINVTDQKVEEAYNQQIKPQENAPALEDVKEQIRSQLEQQQLSEHIADLINKLKEEKEVKQNL